MDRRELGDSFSSCPPITFIGWGKSKEKYLFPLECAGDSASGVESPVKVNAVQMPFVGFMAAYDTSGYNRYPLCIPYY